MSEKTEMSEKTHGAWADLMIWRHLLTARFNAALESYDWDEADRILLAFDELDDLLCHRNVYLPCMCAA